MVLPSAGATFNYIIMFSRFDTIPACDGQTDGRTSWDSIVRAIHTHRRHRRRFWHATLTIA